MQSTNLTPLIDLIAESKDGEWGKGEAFADSVEMLAIRGTDFEKIRVGSIEGIPNRFIQQSIAKRKRLQANDIVIEVAGGTATQPTGRVVLISEEFLAQYPGIQFTCASFSRFVRLNPKKADPVFVYWYLQYLYDSRALAMFHTQHTGVARFQWTVFSNYKLLSLPRREEQQQIGEILNTYSKLIIINAHRKQLLESLISQVYQEWFVRLRFPGYEATPVLNGLPKGWHGGKVGDVLELQRGFDLPAESRLSGSVPIYAAAGQVGFHSISKVTGPGVVTGRSGTIGEVCYVEQNFWPLNTALWMKKYKIGGPLFAYYYLKNVDLKQLAGGAAVPSLDRKNVAATRALVPSCELAERFEKLAQPIHKKITLLVQANEKLQETRDALIPRMLSGKLNVRAFEQALIDQ